MSIGAALVGGALLGLGAMQMMGGRQQSQGFGSYSSTPYQQAASTAPTMPSAPIAPGEDAATGNAAMLAAEEEERRKRAAGAEANRTNYTGGLGLANPASVQRKTLLG